MGTPAAVLVALSPVTGVDDLRVVLVQRPSWLRSHAGQVALPGGGVEPGDADPVAAALREAEEEVNLPPSSVRVLGTLASAFISVSGFDVLPVVGCWDGAVDLTPSPDEVERILQPTLRQLADPNNHGTRTLNDLIGPERLRRPPEAFSPVFEVEGALVWGFTAALLADLLQRLGLSAPPVPASWPGPASPPIDAT